MHPHLLIMSDREPTRWQHNCIYPKPASLCECVIRMHPLYHVHC